MQPEFAGPGTEVVHGLLHGVAYIDQCLHLGLLALMARMSQHFADLRVAAAAVDLLHRGGERRRFRHPARGPTFAQTPKIHKLHVEPADRLRLAKHVALQLAGRVPRRLPAHGRVQRKDQPAAFTRRCALDAAHLGQERIDLGAR